MAFNNLQGSISDTNSEFLQFIDSTALVVNGYFLIIGPALSRIRLERHVYVTVRASFFPSHIFVK